MLDKEYVKALRKMRLYNLLLLGKPYTKKIEVGIDNLKMSCDGFQVSGMSINITKGLEETLNEVASMTIHYIEKAFDIPIYDDYVELAETRIWRWQHTNEYKEIRERLFEYAMQGKANEVEAMLKRLRKCLIDIVEEHWIVKQEQQDVTRELRVVTPMM